MSRRLYWFLVLPCCLVAFVLLVMQSRKDRVSQNDGDVPSSEAGPETVHEIAQKGLPSAQPGDASRRGGPGHEPEQSTSAAISTHHLPNQEAADPGQGAARLPGQTGTSRQPETVSSPAADRPPEVLSYPPLLRQSATNNFLRAMDRLANAKSETDRYHALGDAAKSEFVFGKIDEASEWANELLRLDEMFKDQPWRNGSAVYEANLVLGRIAVLEGRTDEAKQFLLESAMSTGSPVLGSFGPNMGLASDLLQRGEQEAVLEFFDRCRKFWKTGDERLTLWSEDVKSGRMPDFGANLFY